MMGCFGINDDCLLWIALIAIVLVLLGNSDCCGCNNSGCGCSSGNNGCGC